MADGSRRPVGSSQRDAAFSNIFGAAPPAGRGQNQNQKDAGMSRSATTPNLAYYSDSPQHQYSSSAAPQIPNNFSGSASFSNSTGQNHQSVSNQQPLRLMSMQSQSSNSLSAGFDFTSSSNVAPPPPPPVPTMRHAHQQSPQRNHHSQTQLQQQQYQSQNIQHQPSGNLQPQPQPHSQHQHQQFHSPSQHYHQTQQPPPHQLQHQQFRRPPPPQSTSTPPPVLPAPQYAIQGNHLPPSPRQAPGYASLHASPSARSFSQPAHPQVYGNYQQQPPIHYQQQQRTLDPGVRSMSMTSSVSSRSLSSHIDRDPYRSQTMTTSGRVIPRRGQGPDVPPVHEHSLKMSKSSNSTLVENQRSTSTSSHHSDPDHRGSITSHSTILTTSRRVPLVYPAILSRVADTFRQRINLGVRVKDELTYNDAFTGAEAVDVIAYIIKTTDRNLALLLGRALDAQKFFHDVTYDHRLRDTANELYQFSGEAEPVNGVFTLLTECYSPTCTRDQLCYSIACPRRLEQQARLNMKPQSVLKRAESRLSLHADDEKEQKLWIHTVSKETADTVSEKEQKRQEVICELIYTERDFVKDLEYLRDFWIKPLRASKIIPESRKEKLIRAVFGLILDVHAVNVKLAEALTKRQQQAPIVRQVGDIMLEHIPKFEPFIRYGAQQVYAKYEFEREKSINPEFAKFVDETERLKESRKLELNGYLTKPTTRLARYPLLLDAVLKATEEGSPDIKNLQQARTLVRQFLTKVNVESGKAENRLQLMQLNQSLLFRPGERVDLKLTDENRQIIFKGTFKKRTQDKDNQGDVQCYLLDNSLLFVRVKIVNKREQLKVHRKPIPLELLVITESDEAPTKLGLGGKRTPTAASFIPKTTPSTKESAQNKYPILFQHLGRRGYELVLYSSTFIGRKKWVEHIMQQKKVLVEKADVYTQQALITGFFDSNNRVNCVAPLDGGRKLLYGTDNGIFLSDLRSGPNGRMASRPELVIKISTITQIDVIEEYNMLLALSDKTLYSWSLDCLESADSTGNERRARKIMGHINFYKVGLCRGRILVCTAKSGTLNSTVRILEPVDPNPRGKRQPALRKLLNTSANEGLKVFKEFGIPSEIISISFLTSNLCVGCAKGFEIVSLETLESQTLLDPADTSLDFVIRREALKPMAIYRLHKDFLLNYADFSFFVNRNGWRSKPEWMIHWEGLPQNFSISYPYLIAFEPNFVEIRHIDTAELVRVIRPGENIRFLHENTREIMYVYEDANECDVVCMLDFWEKAKSNNGGGANGATAQGQITNGNSSIQNGNGAGKTVS